MATEAADPLPVPLRVTWVAPGPPAAPPQVQTQPGSPASEPTPPSALVSHPSFTSSLSPSFLLSRQLIPHWRQLSGRIQQDVMCVLGVGALLDGGFSTSSSAPFLSASRTMTSVCRLLGAAASSLMMTTVGG